MKMTTPLRIALAVLLAGGVVATGPAAPATAAPTDAAFGTGTGTLNVNRAAAGSWETFALVRNADGSVSLRATVNNRYVVAENGGAEALIANRDAIGPWEKFDLITL